ncbi:hypothetical protein ACFX2K_002409 [Malus domestica]
MKMQADMHMSEKKFAVGDLVYLKLIPYQLQSLALHSYHKLHPKFYGPFEVLERIGKMAYKLKLPDTTKIHHVFHVSCLKKHLAPAANPLPVLPVVTDDGLFPQEPLQVLHRMMYKKGNVAGVQLLIHWKWGNLEDATWEDFDEFIAQFPDFSF